MNVAPSSQHVIPYAETRGRTLDPRGTDDGGIEVVIAPPALGRQLVGPAILLGLLTIAIPMVAALTLSILVRAAGLGGAAIWLVFTAAMLLVWTVVVRCLWRVGRYGRLSTHLPCALLRVTYPIPWRRTSRNAPTTTRSGTST